ncbi:protein Largen [Heteronotia binoei]|uniref:protein Largen n=1 Tax=Heteronotia binoei TaxID=13085 RepID=UPI00292E9A63|nr:protein Largen [Heteronotia binoei]
MSAKSKGTTSSSATSSLVSSPAEGLPAASKAKVKEQIKIIVDDLELVLGDLKDVAKELKEVVDQIDTLTSDLQLEDEMTDSSKTDTLNSSSSSTTASSLEKVKARTNVPLIKPPSAILTVLRKPNPPPPPPRLTPVKCEDPQKPVIPANPVKTNGTLLRNGGLPGGSNKIANGDICCIPNNNLDKVPMQPLMHRPEKDRCPQPGTRERVRFNEKVQYHGYCADCDVRYNIKNREIHLHSESVHTLGKLPHQCPPLPPPPPPLPPFSLENGGMGISPSSSFPPLRPATVPPQTESKPQKTILRKSTTTTV